MTTKTVAAMIPMARASARGSSPGNSGDPARWRIKT